MFASKRFADWTTRYFFAREAEQLLQKTSAQKPPLPLTAGEKIIAGLAGGVLSTLVTIPLDVVVAQVQDKKKAGEKIYFFRSFGQNLRSGQVVAGLLPRMLHVGKKRRKKKGEKKKKEKRSDRARWIRVVATAGLQRQFLRRFLGIFFPDFFAIFLADFFFFFFQALTTAMLRTATSIVYKWVDK